MEHSHHHQQHNDQVLNLVLRYDDTSSSTATGTSTTAAAVPISADDQFNIVEDFDMVTAASTETVGDSTAILSTTEWHGTDDYDEMLDMIATTAVPATAENSTTTTAAAAPFVRAAPAPTVVGGTHNLDTLANHYYYSNEGEGGVIAGPRNFPTAEEENLTPCAKCGRQFFPKVLQRHFPKCKGQKFTPHAERKNPKVELAEKRAAEAKALRDTLLKKKSDQHRFVRGELRKANFCGFDSIKNNDDTAVTAECEHCKRTFAHVEKLIKHRNSSCCTGNKKQKSKRALFDAKRQRLEGLTPQLDMIEFMKKHDSEAEQKREQKHERKMLRKQQKAELKAGQFEDDDTDKDLSTANATAGNGKKKGPSTHWRQEHCDFVKKLKELRKNHALLTKLGIPSPSKKDEITVVALPPTKNNNTATSAVSNNLSSALKGAAATRGGEDLLPQPLCAIGECGMSQQILVGAPFPGAAFVNPHAARAGTAPLCAICHGTIGNHPATPQQ